MVGVVRDQPLLEPATAADFLALYDRSLGEVYSYLFSRLRDRPLAEDLTQEVFLAGARRAAGGVPVELPWLIAVARNKVVDHWRQQGRRERKLSRVESLAEPEPPPDPIEELEESRAADALGGLNATYRLALVLRHVDELPVPAVAEHLGRTVAATEQILTRAKAAFRQAYQGTDR